MNLKWEKILASSVLMSNVMKINEGLKRWSTKRNQLSDSLISCIRIDAIKAKTL